MAGHHHNEDQSLYDFLVDEHEMMAATPSGHLDFGTRPQQPTLTANRTSNERPTLNPPADHRHIPTPMSPISASAAPNAMPLMADQSRAESRSHPSTPFDLHAQSSHATASVFARPTLPASVGHLPIDWGIYGAAQPTGPLHPSPFHFDVPPHNVIAPPYSHHPPSDPALAVAYGHELVSPTNIHAPQSHHYPFGAPWDDGLSHESSTPTVTTPAAVTVTNPWIDPEDGQDEDIDQADPRGKQKGRSKRPKRNTSAGPSTEPTSPSSISQHSRASIGSKSAASIASSSTTSSRPSKLRSASRTSKNNLNKPNDTPEERRTRASHNLVEKQYRNRLNAQFESLLNALPEQIRSAEGEESEPADPADRRVSKGEVLEMARKHIKSLERERDLLEREKNELLGSLRNLKGSLSSEGTTASSQGTPMELVDEDKIDEEFGK